ncbi:uncharacterized protein F4812DRAFT_410730 [Daldinia caldariorum]|uniref:uncharacterized protein n=1 Tax=Daldinia caldariorum TaxID=326644 RepID=UPI002008E057|nr:uncharacterized protein F4812DRAFT_410730 [Daldinia caldariorum]KAI1472879.1 hypothetical protein F4812DRAFT_410730 [Daldinia caldariorum]
MLSKDRATFLSDYVNMIQLRRWTETEEDDDEDEDMTYLEDRSLENNPPTAGDLGREILPFGPETVAKFLNHEEIQAIFRKTYLEPVLLIVGFRRLPIDMVPVLLEFDIMHESRKPYLYLRSQIVMDPQASDIRVIEFIIEVVRFIMSKECREEFGEDMVNPLDLAPKNLVYIAAMMIDLLARQATGLELDLDNWSVGYPSSTCYGVNDDEDFPVF